MSDGDFAAMRAAMVASQLRTSDVTDSAVLAAMSAVPREDYVPAARRTTAYTDRPVPLGNGRAMNPPLATGRLLEVAEIAPGGTVLLVGDPTGYTAALLTHMGAALTVADDAAPMKGRTSGPPYDVILIDGAVAELPASLAAQLAEGGRVALGLVERGVTRLCSGRKGGGSIGFVRHNDMEMVVVPGFEPARTGFVF